MKFYILVVVISVLEYTSIVQSCIFQQTGFNKMHQVDEMQEMHFGFKNREYKRPLDTEWLTGNNESCVCGQEGRKKEKNWLVLVKVSSPKDDKPIRTCFGTVVASNLVVTSHKCLVLKGKRTYAYDVWKPPPKNREVTMATAQNVKISRSDSKEFNVTNVYYNLMYGIEAGANVASANDIALLVVDVNFLQTSNIPMPPYIEHFRTPVCLPTAKESDDLLTKIQHKYGYYCGLGGDFPDDKTPEIRLANELVIMEGEECDKEQKDFGDFFTLGSLCTRTVTPLASIEGGPLLTTNVSGYLILPPENQLKASIRPQTSWMLGLSTVANKRPGGKRISYTYFGNILQNIHFIDKIAMEHNSKWCRTSPFPNTKKATSNDLNVEQWPWETATIKPRSEKLDCACGIKGAASLGRIAGGVDTIPYEFGWMSRLIVDFAGKQMKCGASVLNDRVVLTVAHCITDKNKNASKDGKHSFRNITGNGKLYIGEYKQNEAADVNANLVKVKEIIVHPGFMPNKKNDLNSYDLALLILDEPLKFSAENKNHQRPICLPKFDQKIKLTNGTVLTALGWGLLNPWEMASKQIHPENLQKVNITVRSMKYCVDNSIDVVPNTVFCAGNFTGRLGITEGDAGGPIAFLKPGTGQYFQVGIASFIRSLPEGIVGPDFSPGEFWLSFFVDLQQFIPFIEYYSNLHNAMWCKK